MGDIIEGPFVTFSDVPVEGVLDGAKEEELRHVVVLGLNKDGDEYFATSCGDPAIILWLLERFKKEIMEE